jgi:CheY-like chemotaxis protein
MTKKKVLLVEDDNGIRMAVAGILERQGYLVNSVCDGEEALNQVNDADVVLLDILLPKITGDEFLRRIRSKGNYVPVVLMSEAMPEAEEMECFKEFKIVDYVTKPFKTKDLVDKVGRAAAIAEDISIVRQATGKLKGFIDRQAALG